ncbi:hypothetical protein MRB53_025487 [Persea americana]|uniref:Uncharacterized protein n=1 Tax=Persea americana TaxID=3435 RepID=A0ACC2LG08_PERAE|nr:hypothetical protein MRB53_025487 [Persea americana]
MGMPALVTGIPSPLVSTWGRQKPYFLFILDRSFSILLPLRQLFGHSSLPLLRSLSLFYSNMTGDGRPLPGAGEASREAEEGDEGVRASRGLLLHARETSGGCVRWVTGRGRGEMSCREREDDGGARWIQTGGSGRCVQRGDMIERWVWGGRSDGDEEVGWGGERRDGWERWTSVMEEGRCGMGWISQPACDL